MKAIRNIKVVRAFIIPEGNFDVDGNFYVDITIGEQKIYHVTAKECIELIQKIEERL